MPDAAVAARSSETTNNSATQHVDIAVVGAGFAGLYLLHRLAPGRLQRSRDRGGRRCRRHLVLEPLSRRALRHPDHRLQLHLRSRAGGGVAMVGEVRHPARDPALSRLRRRPLRPAARHPLRHAGHVGALERGDPTLAARDQRRPLGILPLLHHGERLPVRAQAAGDRRRRGLRGRGLRHRALAARRGRLHRQAGRRHRHRLVGHPGDPADRRTGDAPHGVPAHAELRLSGAQRPAAGRARRPAGARPRRLPRRRRGCRWPACRLRAPPSSAGS